jgi:golgi phosphoprotein 3
MPNPSGLYLHEEVLLLAMHETRGTPINAVYAYAVAGAALAELLLADRLGTEQVRKSNRVVLKGRTMMGEPYLDACLLEVAEAKRPANVQTWVSRFASMRDLKARLMERLYMRGLVRKEDRPFLLFFSRTVYPMANPQPRQEIVNPVSAFLFTYRVSDGQSAATTGNRQPVASGYHKRCRS